MKLFFTFAEEISEPPLRLSQSSSSRILPRTADYSRSRMTLLSRLNFYGFAILRGFRHRRPHRTLRATKGHRLLNPFAFPVVIGTGFASCVNKKWWLLVHPLRTFVYHLTLPLRYHVRLSRLRREEYGARWMVKRAESTDRTRSSCTRRARWWSS